MASVLAVVAGSPAQAANTADQYLVDGARPFAGSDRYDTALKLAEHFADNNTPNSIDTVIIASGETQIDAVAAAGLAGYEEAPVLLTRRDQLPKGVATFIEDQGVSRVFVLGGTKAVSEAVREQIESLDSSPTITPVAGPNRYATAAAAAGKILSTARWCGSDDSAVFLANGNQVPITSAIMAGPMSYRMQMPLLLTADDALSSETAEYIDDNNVDRVVIIGNTDEVSEDVADEIAALGASVDRVAGDDPAATSVEVAELMWDNCDGLSTDTSRVALVNADATVDGVTGGPVAGRGIGNDDRPMAILLVGRDLPASVRAWLAGTDVESGGNKTHLDIVAIGGTAVVSNSVMAAAVEAANTAPGLTTEIRPVSGSRTGEAATDTNQFTVVFGDELNQTGDWKRQLTDVLYVNGQLASIRDEARDIVATFTTTPNTDMSCVVGASVQVTLTHNLKATDVIEVRPTGHMFGKDMDRRLLEASSRTVTLTPSTATAPNIEVIAIEGQSKLYLRSGVPGTVPTPANANPGNVVVRSATNGVSVKVAAVAAVTAASGAYEVALSVGAPGFDFDKDGSIGGAGTGEAEDDPYYLAPGDSAWAERNVFTNDNLPSRYVRDEVASRVRSFGATSVLVGSPDTGVNDDTSDDKLPTGLPALRYGDADDSGTLNAGDPIYSQRASTFIGGGYAAAPSGAGTPPASPADVTDPTTWDTQMRITGLWSGDAAGAAGNDWQIAIDSNANYNAAATTAEIDVSVSNRTGVAGGGLIRMQFIAGTPTLGDVAAALMGNDEFADNFLLEYDCANSGRAIDRSSAGFATTATYLTGGVSSVGIQVSWNDWVAALVATDSTSDSNSTDDVGEALRDDVLADLIRGYGTPALATIDTGSLAVLTANGATSDQAQATVGPEGAATALRAPSKSARIVYSTTDATDLPGPRTGPYGGAVTFGGNFYPVSSTNLPNGAAGVAAGGHVAENYLNDGHSDQDAADTGRDKLPAERDDDNFPVDDTTTNPDESDFANTYGRTATSEPVDWANSAQTIRARSGTVQSYR